MKKVIPILFGSVALALSSNIWASNTVSTGSSAALSESYDVAVNRGGGGQKVLVPKASGGKNANKMQKNKLKKAKKGQAVSGGSSEDVAR